MTEQFALNKLKHFALQTLTEYINRFPTRNIQLPDIKFTNSFNVGGEFDLKKNLIQLNRQHLKTFGYEEVKKIMLHELAHLLAIKIFNCFDHGFHFKYMNRKLGGIE